MDIVIVGAGIGGLAAALALHARGHESMLYESAGEIAELGVGINLLPHAVRVLADLGLKEALVAEGIETAELIYFNKYGQTIWQEPRGLAAGYPWPQVSIHRGRLHGLLLAEVRRRLGPDAIVPGHHLAEIETQGRRPRMRFVERDSGTTRLTRNCDLAIGADGIHSAVRRQLHPGEGPPIWNGAVLWRALTESAPFLTGRSMFMAGHANQKFVCYPVSRRHLEAGRSLTNWVAELRFDPASGFRREDWNRRADKADFRPSFSGWAFDWLDIPGLIDATEAVYEYPMVDRDPIERWSFGRVTLLGDAAHPMYPVGSNGASQAILDAEALAESLDGAADPEAALLAYQEQRLGPTAGIVRANRQQGPEQVMQMVEERAPEGFARLEDVISRKELEGVAARYKQLAGFDREKLEKLAGGDG